VKRWKIAGCRAIRPTSGTAAASQRSHSWSSSAGSCQSRYAHTASAAITVNASSYATLASVTRFGTPSRSDSATRPTAISALVGT
jgi:hypothetical protein